MLSVLGNAVIPGHIQRFPGQQPVNQGIGAGGIHGDIGNSLTIGVGEGCVRVHGKKRVSIEHFVICFLQDAGVNHQFGLGRGLSGGFGRRLGGSGSGSRSFGGLLSSAAGSQTQQHHGNQKQGNALFHIRSSKLFKIKQRAGSKGKRTH